MQPRELLKGKASDSDEDEDDSDYEPSEDSEESSDGEDEDEEQKKEFDVEAFNRSKELWDQCASKIAIPKTNLSSSSSQDGQPASVAGSASHQIASKFDESNEVPLKMKTEADSIASSASSSNLKPMPAKPRGMSASLGKLGEKRKMSILESSRLQWNTFKEETGIQEELEAHNRSKNSYLDKQDFLARTDYKEYMIMRNKSLSSRK